MGINTQPHPYFYKMYPHAHGFDIPVFLAAPQKRFENKSKTRISHRVQLQWSDFECECGSKCNTLSAMICKLHFNQVTT